jgi:hypothetical protein
MTSSKWTSQLWRHLLAQSIYWQWPLSPTPMLISPPKCPIAALLNARPNYAPLSCTSLLYRQPTSFQLTFWISVTLCPPSLSNFLSLPIVSNSIHGLWWICSKMETDPVALGKTAYVSGWGSTSSGGPQVRGFILVTLQFPEASW